jgi:hypothetical protein
MRKTAFILLSFLLPLGLSAQNKDKGTDSGKAKADLRNAKPVLWVEPTDISSRNLRYGPGGEKDQPASGSVKFEKEDSSGTNIKFDVEDSQGRKYRVKLGPEARSETAATRLLWAVGYFADEDYFVKSFDVQGMPKYLKRGHGPVAKSELKDARFELRVKHREKPGEWEWNDNPFKGTREFNGLRTLMALMNSWDVKDQNNSIYIDKDDPATARYVVSDVGASFGSTGYNLAAFSKGNVNSYRRSKFIKRVKDDYVDFNVPTRPSLIHLFTPGPFFSRLKLDSFAKHVPRKDARWMGDLLARLSPEQLRDAFRAAGFTDNEVDAYVREIQKRIAELEKL